ncbi:MAG: cell division FtsA domain-containing protein [Eubacteriales bacterium]|nr:cell division FtsA domain-containing protein [Eubacteriales bacterium]
MNFISVMDIGTSKLAVLMGNRGINNTLKILASSSQEYAGYYNGEFVEPEKLNEDIANALAKAEINANAKIKKLYVGVPADFCTCITKQFMQNFSDKLKIEESDILEIYQQANELKDNDKYILISCSPIYFVLDDGRQVINPIGEKTSRISGEISYIYAEKSFISKINVALRMFGISSVEYLSSTLAENMYLLSDSKRLTPSILIDCGFVSTSVSITKGNGLLSLNSFSVGGGQITSDLCECLKISYKEAEELKKQIILSVVPQLSDGYELKKQNQVSLIPMTEANEIVSARLEMICALINKCLTSTQKKDLYKMPFYLTGGGICFIKGSKDYLSKYFGVNVEILSPPNLQLSKPNYSALLGLLNSAINQENKQKTNKFLNFFKRLTKR